VSKAGWTPFAGKRLHGRVITTLVRGQPVIADSMPVNPEAPGGQFLPGPGATSA
jgi:dihydroorotase